MPDLSAQKAIVTGAARGIGLAISRHLQAAGAQVEGWDLTPSDEPCFAGFRRVDVTDERGGAGRGGGRRRGADPGQQRRRWRPHQADVGVHAGGVEPGPGGRPHRGVPVLAGTWCPGCAPAATAASSPSPRSPARKANPDAIAYGAAKSGAIGFTKTMARELAGSGVLANSIAPAMTETEFLAGMAPEVHRRPQGAHPPRTLLHRGRDRRHDLLRRQPRVQLHHRRGIRRLRRPGRLLTRLCVHQVSFGRHDFATCVATLARHDIRLTAVWHDKLAAIGTPAAARLLADHEVQAVALCPGGLLTARDSAEWRAALEHNRRLLDDAAAIGADSLVTVAGGLAQGERDLRFARDRALEGIAALLPDARAAGIKLALEPLHPMTCAFRGVLTTVGPGQRLVRPARCRSRRRHRPRQLRGVVGSRAGGTGRTRRPTPAALASRRLAGGHPATYALTAACPATA